MCVQSTVLNAGLKTAGFKTDVKVIVAFDENY